MFFSKKRGFQRALYEDGVIDVWNENLDRHSLDASSSYAYNSDVAFIQ